MAFSSKRRSGKSYSGQLIFLQIKVSHQVWVTWSSKGTKQRSLCCEHQLTSQSNSRSFHRAMFFVISNYYTAPTLLLSVPKNLEANTWKSIATAHFEGHITRTSHSVSKITWKQMSVILCHLTIYGHAKKGISGIHQLYWFQPICLPCRGSIHNR